MALIRNRSRFRDLAERKDTSNKCVLIDEELNNIYTYIIDMVLPKYNLLDSASIIHTGKKGEILRISKEGVIYWANFASGEYLLDINYKDVSFEDISDCMLSIVDHRISFNAPEYDGVYFLACRNDEYGRYIFKNVDSVKYDIGQMEIPLFFIDNIELIPYSLVRKIEEIRPYKTRPINVLTTYVITENSIKDISENYTATFKYTIDNVEFRSITKFSNIVNIGLYGEDGKLLTSIVDELKENVKSLYKDGIINFHNGKGIELANVPEDHSYLRGSNIHMRFSSLTPSTFSYSKEDLVRDFKLTIDDDDFILPSKIICNSFENMEFTIPGESVAIPPINPDDRLDLISESSIKISFYNTLDAGDYESNFDWYKSIAMNFEKEIYDQFKKRIAEIDEQLKGK